MEKPARTPGTLALAKYVNYAGDPSQGPCVSHLQSVYLKPGSSSSEDGMLHRRGGGGWQNRGVQQSFLQILQDLYVFMCSCPFPWGLFPPWTSSDPEEVLRAYVVAAVPMTLQVPGSLGIRTVTGLDACAFPMVCAFLGKGLLFRFQCQSAPSL